MNWKTWPNLITAVGFAGIGVYVWAYLNYKTQLVLPILILVGLTDFFDGRVARATGQISTAGIILDPIRDKLALLAVLGNIVFLYGTEAVILPVALILAFETAGAILNISRGIPQLPNLMGKIRGFFHFSAAGLILFSAYYVSFLGATAITLVVSLMALFSLLAFIGYLFFPKKTPA